MLIYNMILVRIVFLQILRRAFPDAAGQPFQGLRLGIPFVEIADQGHGLRVWRPHPENISILPGGMAPEHLIGAAVLSPAKGRQGLFNLRHHAGARIAVHEHPSMVDWRPNHSRRAPRGISAVRPQVLFSMSDCHRIGSDYLYCSNCLCELQAFLVSFLKQIVNEFNILVYKAQQSICIPRQIAFQGSPHSLSISQPCYKTCRNLKIADSHDHP